MTIFDQHFIGAFINYTINAHCLKIFAFLKLSPNLNNPMSLV